MNNTNKMKINKVVKEIRKLFLLLCVSESVMNSSFISFETSIFIYSHLHYEKERN